MTHAQNADSFTFRGLKMSPQSFVFFFLGYLLNAHAFAQQSWQTRGELPPIAVIWQKKKCTSAGEIRYVSQWMKLEI